VEAAAEALVRSWGVAGKNEGDGIADGEGCEEGGDRGSRGDRKGDEEEDEEDEEEDEEEWADGGWRERGGRGGGEEVGGGAAGEGEGQTKLDQLDDEVMKFSLALIQQRLPERAYPRGRVHFHWKCDRSG